MSVNNTPMSRGTCVVCGKKDIIVPDARDLRQGNVFCSRVCRTNRKYSKRYSGGLQTDKPNILDKIKEY